MPIYIYREKYFLRLYLNDNIQLSSPDNLIHTPLYHPYVHISTHDFPRCQNSSQRVAISYISTKSATMFCEILPLLSFRSKRICQYFVIIDSPDAPCVQRNQHPYSSKKSAVFSWFQQLYFCLAIAYCRLSTLHRFFRLFR